MLRVNWKLHFAVNAGRLGLLEWECSQILRDAKRLQTWAEAECNGDIERDEVTGKAFRTYNHNGPGPIKRYPTRDTETPARKRIEQIAKEHGLVACFQGDPRGAIVTLCKPEDVKSDFEYRGVTVPS